MKVHISQAVVASAIGTRDLLKLHQLLLFACEGRHVVLFDTPSALNECLNTIDAGSRSIYSTALGQMERVAAQLPANAAAIRIENTASPSWDDPLAVLPLDRALAALSVPLGIIMENATNDWCFLLGIMRPSERDRIRKAVDKGWAKPLHGGGSNLRTELPRRLERQEEALRTFVMFDSDRRHPDELTATWEPTRTEACQGFVIQKLLHPQLQQRHWMLKRRFIESYMPESEMNKEAMLNNRADAVNAFFRMSQHARWYFNMKKGFKGDESIENRHRCLDLYVGVANADRVLLHEGFGRKFADQYQQALTYEFDWDAEARQEAFDTLPRLMRLL